RVERLEDPRQDLGRDARTIIDDLRHDRAPVGAQSRAQHDAAGGPGLVDRLLGIEQEVEKHLLDLLLGPVARRASSGPCAARPASSASAEYSRWRRSSSTNAPTMRSRVSSGTPTPAPRPWRPRRSRSAAGRLTRGSQSTSCVVTILRSEMAQPGTPSPARKS